MNDDCSELENELRGLQPRGVSEQLEHRIGTFLDHRPFTRQRAHWWQRFGFNHPSAAFGCGLASPVLTGIAVFAVLHAAGIDHPPALPTIHPAAPTDGSVNSSNVASAHLLARKAEDGTVHATNLIYRTLDEGVVLDGEHEPVHRVRYRSADLVQWRNPDTGARWEVSYPREDVRLVPVHAD